MLATSQASFQIEYLLESPLQDKAFLFGLPPFFFAIVKKTPW